MSAFAKQTFNAAGYAAARPSYPPALFEHVMAYLDQAIPRGPGPRTLLDLGCGPGLSTFDWLPHRRFDRIQAIDPSSGMISAANGILSERRKAGSVPGNVDLQFHVARADALPADVVADESVDLAVAGQAAHWFDASATYAELARVLKPGGAFAFWGYGEFYFPTRPELSALVPPYSAGTLGPYWEQPGRSIVEALLTPFPFPAGNLSPPFNPGSFTRSFFLRALAETESKTLPFRIEGLAPDAPEGDYTLPPPPPAPSASSSPSPSSVPRTTPRTVHLHRSGSLLKRHWTRAQLVAYLRTWSAAHAYNEQRGATGAGGSDCVDAFMDRLEQAGFRLDEGRGETIEVAWDVGVLLGRKQ